jgi:hypothetical protein
VLPSPRSHVGVVPGIVQPTTNKPLAGVAETPGVMFVRASE